MNLPESHSVPRFGYAKNRSGVRSGLVDYENGISYKTIGGGVGPTVTVESVAYLQEDAPVWSSAKVERLDPSMSAALIASAQAMK